MNKKIIFLCIIFFIILGNVTVFASNDVNFSISSQENVKAGDTVKLKITADNIENQDKKISGFKLDVFYEKSNFEFVNANGLDAVSGAIGLHENYENEGRIRIGVASLMGLKKSGDVYEITLKAKEQINKIENPITLQVKEIIDSENNEIPYTIKNGTVTFEKSAIKNEEEIVENKNIQEEQAPKVENNNEEKSSEEKQQSEEDIQNNTITLKKEEKQNIKEILKNDNTINKEGKLTYEVENPEILEIDEEGNVVAKQEGSTNIKVTDEQGNTKILPMSVIENTTSEVQENTKTENTNFVVASIIIIILIVTGLIVYMRKKQKSNSK